MTETKQSYETILAVINEKLKNIVSELEKQGNKIDVVNNKIDSLPTVYPTRREFTAVKWVFTIVVSIIGVVGVCAKFL